MDHFLQYHKISQMGYPISSCRDLSVLVKKRKESLCNQSVGNVVWLISGTDDSPVKFFLSAAFVCESVVKEPPGSDFYVRGIASKTRQLNLGETLEITANSDFVALKENLAYFARGFSKINNVQSTSLISALPPADLKSASAWMV